jgi:hypothetical protein
MAGASPHHPHHPHHPYQCPPCKEFELKLANITRQLEAAKRSGGFDDEHMQELEAEQEQALADCNAHLLDDLHLRGFMKWMTDLGKQTASEEFDRNVTNLTTTSSIVDPDSCHAAAQVAASVRAQSAREPGPTRRLRWQPTVTIYHYDARRAVEVAKVPMETAGAYLRYSVGMDGYFDKVRRDS